MGNSLERPHFRAKIVRKMVEKRLKNVEICRKWKIPGNSGYRWQRYGAGQIIAYGRIFLAVCGFLVCGRVFIWVSRKTSYKRKYGVLRNGYKK